MYIFLRKVPETLGWYTYFIRFVFHIKSKWIIGSLLCQFVFFVMVRVLGRCPVHSRCESGDKNVLIVPVFAC